MGVVASEIGGDAGEGMDRRRAKEKGGSRDGGEWFWQSDCLFGHVGLALVDLGN